MLTVARVDRVERQRSAATRDDGRAGNPRAPRRGRGSGRRRGARARSTHCARHRRSIGCARSAALQGANCAAKETASARVRAQFDATDATQISFGVGDRRHSAAKPAWLPNIDVGRRPHARASGRGATALLPQSADFSRGVAEIYQQLHAAPSSAVERVRRANRYFGAVEVDHRLGYYARPAAPRSMMPAATAGASASPAARTLRPRVLAADRGCAWPEAKRRESSRRKRSRASDQARRKARAAAVARRGTSAPRLATSIAGWPIAARSASDRRSADADADHRVAGPGESRRRARRGCPRACGRARPAARLFGPLEPDVRDRRNRQAPQSRPHRRRGRVRRARPAFVRTARASRTTGFRRAATARRDRGGHDRRSATRRGRRAAALPAAAPRSSCALVESICQCTSIAARAGARNGASTAEAIRPLSSGSERPREPAARAARFGV